MTKIGKKKHILQRKLTRRQLCIWTSLSMYKSPRELWPVNEKLNPTYKTLHMHRLLSQQTLKSGLKNQNQGIKISASTDIAYWPDKHRFISFDSS